MIVIDHTVLSDDIKDEHFVCDLAKCKGACCIEGDLGAPLAVEELPEVEACLPVVMPYLSQEAQTVIEQQGAYLLDEEGDYSTTTIRGQACVFAVYDEHQTLKCGLEQAYLEGKTTWKKPISCELYPIRVTVYDHYEALNYDRWDICDPACRLGDTLKTPLYQFLKKPLIRKYGAAWYNALLEQVAPA